MTRRRGFIYFAHLDEAEEPKPVLIVSWNAVNDGIQQPICALVTSRDRERALPTHVELAVGDGVREPSWVL